MTVERWTDEMLDELASSVTDLRDAVSGLQVTSNALLEIAQLQQRNWEQSQRRHEESDQRFEVLLAEVRHLIGRLDQTGH